MKMLNKIKGKFKNEAHEREFNKINEAGLEKAYKQSRKKLDDARLTNPQKELPHCFGNKHNNIIDPINV